MAVHVNPADVIKLINDTGSLFQKLANRWADAELECMAFQSDLAKIGFKVQAWQTLVGPASTGLQQHALARIQRDIAAVIGELKEEEGLQASSWFSRQLCLWQRSGALTVPGRLAKQIKLLEGSMQKEVEGFGDVRKLEDENKRLQAQMRLLLNRALCNHPLQWRLCVCLAWPL
jgi:hypothetical protein